MAQITEVRLLDDLDGGEAAESMSFSLDGKSYEIDLNEKHAAALRDAFAPFIGSARRAGGPAADAPPDLDGGGSAAGGDRGNPRVGHRQRARRVESRPYLFHRSRGVRE